jgi:hypothetical protein
VEIGLSHEPNKITVYQQNISYFKTNLSDRYKFDGLDTPKNKICWHEKFGPLSQKTHGF